jgi:hypothetical protein
VQLITYLNQTNDLKEGGEKRFPETQASIDCGVEAVTENKDPIFFFRD